MLIRKMETSDIDRIVELEKQLFTSAWSKEDFVYELTVNPYGCYLVVDIDNQVQGYIGVWLMGDQSQITTLGIDKQCQGQGLSKKLMDCVIEITKELKYPRITLEVRVSNNKAISLYQQYGFKQAALRKNYYQDNHEDAYLMIKEMEG